MKQEERYKIINGNSLEVLDTFEENSIDAIITDPPYELGFMGKKWDSTGIAYNVELWKKAYKVLKSGGHLLAFGGTRTYHRIACAIEDAGFEIRDCIMCLYGSGFPKSMNVGLAIDKKNGVDNRTGAILKGFGSNNTISMKNGLSKSQEFAEKYEERKATNEWAGWGTCLKPAYEPIIVARKPVEDSIINNVIKYGVGGINIDECRVPFEDTPNPATNPLYRKNKGYKLPEKQCKSNGAVDFTSSKNDTNDLGRFPANVILTYEDNDFNEVCGGMPDTKSVYNEDSKHETNLNRKNSDVLKYGYKERIDTSSYNDEGNAGRYFYCAKASKKDRDNGLDILETKEISDGCKRSNAETSNKFGSGQRFGKNIHPTVKPCELMQYLVKLVTPKGGLY